MCHPHVWLSQQQECKEKGKIPPLHMENSTGGKTPPGGGSRAFGAGWSSASPRDQPEAAAGAGIVITLLNCSIKHPSFLLVGKSCRREDGGAGVDFFPDCNFLCLHVKPWCSKTSQWVQMILDTDLKKNPVIFWHNPIKFWNDFSFHHLPTNS